ncbi:hypothetical protein F0919_13220 [Taibaiella lutea]|uniref:Uncharacterized protein n=1 Tax=Taibaiella lutea TaxID=2608001 RepID=A0A5M6CEK4_9BACT|nr:hypothetical protein [Taibaiella lutea]KAA5533496.1 hypothetical protein F0919_13220 [Taibaiella lutea]
MFILTDYKIQFEPVSFKTSQDTVTILASVITKGAATLYQSQIDPERLGLDEAVSPFYVIKSSRGTFPLLHNTDPTKRQYNKFKGILNYATGECNDQQQMNRLRYTLKDILDVVLSYNKCKDPNSTPATINTKPQIPAIVSHQLLIGGVIASKAQLSSDDIYIERYSGGAGFNVAYCLQAIYPAISKKISTEFSLGLTYAKYKSEFVTDKTYNYFAGRIKILGGFNLSDKPNVMPIIQFGPSFEFQTNLLSINPLANVGFGIGLNRYFIGGLVEFPFTSFNDRSFYSLNFKYTFAKSKDKKSNQ